MTIQTTELTEHLRKGSEEYDRLTRTVTESGKEMVNGVVKNYKTVTKYVTDHGKTTAQTQKTYEEIAATVRDTVTSTFDSVVDGVRTSTQTVTETLTDETTQQKQIITKTCTDIVNGMLVTKEQVETIAADGARTTAETIKEASANTFSGLLKGWQEEADKGILGTFDTLVTAIKKQDWKSVGEWVLSTLYTGLAPEAKQWIDKLGTSLIQQINGVLLKGVQGVSQGAWNLGGRSPRVSPADLAASWIRPAVWPRSSPAPLPPSRLRLALQPPASARRCPADCCRHSRPFTAPWAPSSPPLALPLWACCRPSAQHCCPPASARLRALP